MNHNSLTNINFNRFRDFKPKYINTLLNGVISTFDTEARRIEVNIYK